MIKIRAFAVAALSFLGSGPLHAQFFEDAHHTVEAPYAGRYEARIGGWGESEKERVRLDIGASVDVFSIGDSTMGSGGVRRERSRLTLGADFFTWSRLRSDPDFKFPVEDVDYFFGVRAALKLARSAGLPPLLSDFRLRIGHISAHAVDGNPAIDSAIDFEPFVYSREFFDVMAGSDGARWGRVLGLSPATVRPYLGVLWVFHNVPDIAGRVNPYGGVDVDVPLGEAIPLVVRFGYEARLNTELDERIGEHQLRLGLKIGEPTRNGVILEGGYFSGRSMFGQRGGDRESFMFYGFAVDF